MTEPAEPAEAQAESLSNATGYQEALPARFNSIWPASSTSIPGDTFMRCIEPTCECEGKLYHCPLCVQWRIKGMKLSKLKQHFDAIHWKPRIGYQDYQYLRCYLKCDTGEEKCAIDGISHYHCNTCPVVQRRPDRFTKHLRTHKNTTIGHDQDDTNTAINPDPDRADVPATVAQNESPGSYVDVASEKSDSLSNTNGFHCASCTKQFSSKRSLQNHLRYYHFSPDYISATRHLFGNCVDPEKGVYMIRRSFSGTDHPVHVLHNFGANGGISCEVNDCRELSNTAKRSGNPNFICNHLKSVQYVTKTSNSRYMLPREYLQELVDKSVPWLKRGREEECLQLQQSAVRDKAPLIAEFNSGTLTSTSYCHFSVHDEKIHHYSRFQRVIVTYDRNRNTWVCGCCRRKVNCVHKSIAKWFMYVERPNELFTGNSTGTTAEQSDSDDEFSEPEASETTLDYPVSSTSYPPREESILAKMVQYIHSCKKIPVILHREITHDLDEYQTKLVPTEEKCHYCNVDLSEAKEITRRGRLFTTTKVIDGIAIYFKLCPECGMVYRYQEYEDGIHNFDDFHCFSLSFMLFLRAFVGEHTALGRAASAFSEVAGVKIDQSVMRNAYYHFEAITNHLYNFSCVLCGYYPPHLNWDLCKKGCFSLMLGDVDIPPECDDSDQISTQDFWTKVEQMHIAKGLTDNLGRFTVKASYSFWAPWIGPHTRKNDVVYNTEYRKCHQITQEDVLDPSSLPSYSEEDLLDMMNFSHVNVLQKLCGQMGAKQSSRLTKLEAVGFLRRKLNVPEHFRKIFTKIWGASGDNTAAYSMLVTDNSSLPLESPNDSSFPLEESSGENEETDHIPDLSELVATEYNMSGNPFERVLANGQKPRGFDNAVTVNNQGLFSLLQCLATCDLVDSPSANDFSWLLYYLARPQIAVTEEIIEHKLLCFLSTNKYIEKEKDPAKILERICSLKSISSACGGCQRVQVICRSCGRSSEIHEETFNVIINLPRSDRASVESRLLKYFEHEEGNGAFCFCEHQDLVRLQQPVILPAMLICNMIAINDDGLEVPVRTKPETTIRLYDTNARCQMYQLSACITNNMRNDADKSYSCIVKHGDMWHCVDNKIVHSRSNCEAGWDEHMYLLFYKKIDQDDIKSVIVVDDCSESSCSDVILKRNKIDIQTADTQSGFERGEVYSKPAGISDISISLINKVQNCWNIGNGQNLGKVISEIGQNTLTQYDIKSLDDNPLGFEIQKLSEFARRNNETFHTGWINDKIMNSFFTFLHQRSKEKGEEKIEFVSSLIYSKLCNYGVHSVGRFFAKKNVLQSDLCFFPINQNNQHWCLGVIDQRTDTLAYYDPLGGKCSQFPKKIRLLLIYLARLGSLQLPNLTNLINKEVSEPKQLDSMSCGIFVCIVADYLAKSLPTDFTQNDIPLLRKYIAAQLTDPRASLEMSKRVQKFERNQSEIKDDHQAYTSKLTPEEDLQKNSDSHSHTSNSAVKRTLRKGSSHTSKKRQKVVIENILSLPWLVLEKILKYVLQDGDFMFLQLSLVCSGFYNVVKREKFRKSVHFTWLNSIYNWDSASPDFKNESKTMYEIKTCFQCGDQFKEMYGFIGHGKFGEYDKYYSDNDHLGYCSNACMQV